MRKILFLTVLMMLAESCTINRELESIGNSNKDLVNHEFVTGQWVTTSDFIRLKNRDLTPPHPFDGKEVPPLTCIREGRPYFDNIGTIITFLEKKGDHYEAVYDFGKSTLQFNTNENDTTLNLEYQYQSNEPVKLMLSKVPTARSCDYEVSPGDGITSAITVAYNLYYFKGKYSVNDIDNNSTTDVEITSDFHISGLKEYDAYRLYTFGSYIRVELYKRQKSYRTKIWKIQKFKLIPNEYGFDLYAMPKASYIKETEKLYEFRRK